MIAPLRVTMSFAQVDSFTRVATCALAKLSPAHRAVVTLTYQQEFGHSASYVEVGGGPDEEDHRFRGTLVLSATRNFQPGHR